MIELREALAQISEIRQQMAQTEVFRGYRAATVAFSGVAALAAAGVQSLLVPRPTHDVRAYLLVWVGAALASVIVFGVEQARRYRRSAPGSLQRDITLMAVEQFLPSLVAGATVTYVLAAYARDQAWMLPGLWAVIFSLGVFASRRLLPHPIFWVGAFYLLAGLACLARGQEWRLSPWMMGLTFGVGQLGAAAVLYWFLERNHGEESE